MKRTLLISTLLFPATLLVGCADAPKEAGETSPQQAEAAPAEPGGDTGPVEVAKNDKPATDQTDQEPDAVAEAPQEYNQLTAEEERIILNKGTEWAGTGKLLKNKDKGTYICRRCNAPLFKSDHKFESNCGWPSFDDEIEGAVQRKAEDDGTGRTEIVCANCGGHLGHVFLNEGFTTKQTRHCVNSVSMDFVKAGEELPPVIKPNK